MFNAHRNYTLTSGLKGTTIAVVADSPTRVDVLYHRTTVVSRRGQFVTLRNGGWDTVSTRIVINRALAEMSAGMWLERRHGDTYLCSDAGVRRPFVSGMRIRLERERAEVAS